MDKYSETMDTGPGQIFISGGWTKIPHKVTFTNLQIIVGW